MEELKMEMAELLGLPATFGIETAGRAFGWGRTKAHELANAGEFPCEVLRKGKKYVVTKAALFAALGIPPAFLFTTDPNQVPSLTDSGSFPAVA